MEYGALVDYSAALVSCLAVMTWAAVTLFDNYMGNKENE